MTTMGQPVTTAGQTVVSRARRESAEVLYALDAITAVGWEDVAALKASAGAPASGRVRLCLHPSVDHALHEMLIVHRRGVYVRPHKHVGKAESLLVIEGRVDVVLFDEGGRVVRVTALRGVGERGGRFYHRINASVYHTLLIRSEVVVFHEVTSGPFRRSETVFAPWSPGGCAADGSAVGDAGAVGEAAAFVSAVERAVAAWRTERAGGVNQKSKCKMQNDISKILNPKH